MTKRDSPLSIIEMSSRDSPLKSKHTTRGTVPNQHTKGTVPDPHKGGSPLPYLKFRDDKKKGRSQGILSRLEIPG